MADEELKFEIDFAAIELRLLAQLAGDRETFDPHKARAAKEFGVTIEDVTKEQRVAGKALNFADCYSWGMKGERCLKLEGSLTGRIQRTNEMLFSSCALTPRKKSD